MPLLSHGFSAMEDDHDLTLHVAVLQYSLSRKHQHAVDPLDISVVAVY